MQGCATNIAKKLENLFIVGFIHLMLDFIEVLSIFSSLLQHNDISLVAAKDGLEVAWLELKAMVARPAHELSEFLSTLSLPRTYRYIVPVTIGVD